MLRPYIGGDIGFAHVTSTIADKAQARHRLWTDWPHRACICDELSFLALASAGKSFSLGRPSRAGKTVSA
jgi:hypothetical protein